MQVTCRPVKRGQGLQYVKMIFRTGRDLLPLVAPFDGVREFRHVLVQGGGITGQTGAVRLGIARALVKYDENLRNTLRGGGHMTRDPRIKERKKPGLKRARKAPTYTKR